MSLALYSYDKEIYFAIRTDVNVMTVQGFTL